MRDGGKAASGAESELREGRMNFGRAFGGGHSRGFGDGSGESGGGVGIDVDEGAAKVRDARKGFAFEEVEELGGEGAALGIFDVREKFAGPEGTCEIPFQIALGERVRKIAKRGVDFGEEAAQTFEKFD